MGISEGDYEAWYKVDKKAFAEVGGEELLSRYGGWMSSLLADVFPEHNWMAFRFGRVPARYWTSIDHQRAFLDYISLQLGISKEKLDGWYNARWIDLKRLGASRILDLYDGSLSRLLAAVYPNHPWDVSKFAVKPQNYWSSLENQKKFMDELAEKLGIRALDGWYAIRWTDLKGKGASSILNHYGGSLPKVLATVYPSYHWDESKFSGKPRNYWSSLINQRKFMDELSNNLGLRDLDGWYAIRWTDLVPLGAWRILDLYEGSLSKLLAAVYPHHPWDISKFTGKHRNYWSSSENQRRFMEDLGKKIGINSDADLEKWYHQSSNLIIESGGSGLLAIYQNSLPKLLASLYPHYDWQLWKFPRRIGKVLKSDEELEKLFSNLEKSLNIRRPEDWYRVTTEQLTSHKVPSLYKSIDGGLVAMLSKRYPTIDWDADAFFGRGYRRATQRWLTVMLNDLFPTDAFLVDYSHPELKCQLDVFFPDLNLAFEYQGLQHYEEVAVFGDVSDRMARDVDKAALCSTRGISLIAVPYWWNKKRPALLASLLAIRPDLFTSKLSSFLEEARRGTAHES